MISKELYEELSSGKWIEGLLRPHVDERTVELLKMKCALHFQQLFTAYQNTLSQEESDDEAERQRISEDINRDPTPDNIARYREIGWKISTRAKKSLDMAGFLEDHRDAIPEEAFAVIKTKLPKHLQKELARYESFEGYTYIVKRSQTAEEE